MNRATKLVQAQSGQLYNGWVPGHGPHVNRKKYNRARDKARARKEGYDG